MNFVACCMCCMNRYILRITLNLNVVIIVICLTAIHVSQGRTEYGKNECKALETAAFHGNVGEVYLVRLTLSTPKSDNVNICRKYR